MQNIAIYSHYIYCTFTVHRQVFIAVVIDSKVDLGEGREGSSTVGAGCNYSGFCGTVGAGGNW